MSPAGFDSFFDACGGDGPLVVRIVPSAVSSDVVTEPRVVAQPYLVVGRLPKADISLDDSQVSRRHAYFQLLGGRLYGVDLGSRTGTFLAGKRLEAGWIDSGQDVSIGPFGFRLLSGGGGQTGVGSIGERAEAGAADEFDPLSSAFGHARSELPLASFEVAAPGIRPRIWKMGGALAFVGHGALCRLRLQDRRIARYHCSLVRTPEGLWAVDLLTEWGTEHNGALVRSRRLLPEDRLGVGPFSIRLLEARTAISVRARHGAALSGTTTSGTLAERTHARLEPQPAEWFPAGGGPGTTSSAPALPWDAAQRLDALERRQEVMQDQFQQAIVLMLNAFSGMHREQMEVLTSELAEVRRLSAAIDGLQAELLRKPAEVPGSGATKRPAGAATVPPNANEPAPWSNPDMCDLESPRVHRDPREVHAFVSERLAAFERDRQSRWNRILRTLTRSS